MPEFTNRTLPYFAVAAAGIVLGARALIQKRNGGDDPRDRARIW